MYLMAYTGDLQIKIEVFSKKNPRLNMMVGLFDKMKKERKDTILSKAQKFLEENTQ